LNDAVVDANTASSPADRTPPGADAVRKPTRAIEISLDAWNQALFDELFPPVPELGCPTVLACDDETVRAAARRLGLPVLGGVSSLVQEIRLAHHINPRNGLKELMLIGSADSRGGGNGLGVAPSTAHPAPASPHLRGARRW
jgi:hypothetical protein